ncbi:zinc finger protein 524-like, partial [Pyrgilauda ruficollis]|uniref:zinc finger protein 524-like n=1 Tax=Pyrgilauda ruficollis TaxID=221976 RepID=UPI001B863C8C
GPGGGTFLLIDSQGLPYTVLLAQGGAASAGPAPGPARFACPDCGRGFAYLSYLRRHRIAHSALKPHRCRACGKAFKRRSHLQRHRGTTHGLQGQEGHHGQQGQRHSEVGHHGQESQQGQ